MKILPTIIINFHAVHNPQWMNNTLQLLKKLYNMVSVDEIREYYYNGKKLNNACHITFDDGDVSFYKVVFPLLKRYNIPASIYVSPKVAVDKTNFWFQEISDYNLDLYKDLLIQVVRSNSEIEQDVTTLPIKPLIKNLPINIVWEAIYLYQQKTNTFLKKGINLNRKQLLHLDSSDLITIGAHTLNHPILKNESDESVRREITESIDELANLLDKKIYYFAYPNGVPDLDFGLREIEILKNTSIKLAFSTEKKAISKTDNLLSIPRKGITKGSRSFITIKLLTGDKWKFMKQLITGKQENDFRKQ